MLRETLAALPIAYDKFAFVDYGSGKARTLLIASEFPFKFIIGVEFAAELHRICEANLKLYRNPARRCLDIRPIHQDVATFDPPAEPLVLYFYNPFDRVIFDAVISRLHNSLRRHPRPVWIVYINPKDRQRLDGTPFLEAVAANSTYCIYRSLPADWANRMCRFSEPTLKRLLSPERKTWSKFCLCHTHAKRPAGTS